MDAGKGYDSKANSKVPNGKTLSAASCAKHAGKPLSEEKKRQFHHLPNPLNSGTQFRHNEEGQGYVRSRYLGGGGPKWKWGFFFAAVDIESDEKCHSWF